MNAISINLLIEEQLTQQALARDPFKVTVISGGAVFAVLVALGVLFGRLAVNKTEEVAMLQSKWDKMQSRQAKTGGTDTKTLQAVANDYLDINKARLVFAPQLALVKEIIPESIQLSAIRFAQVAETVAGPAAPAAGVSDAKAARMAKPKTVERLNLVLEGFATSARPEIELDLFIKSLRTHPVFSKLVDDVRLRAITRSGGKADGGMVTPTSVSFSIDCVYKEVK
ncbi:MAG: hypothetical protein WCS70_12105 [Verrucomicrobiota bacterium]